VKRLLLVFGLFWFTSPGYCHDNHIASQPMSFETLLKTYHWDFKSADIRVHKINEQLHVLFGVGGNIAVSIGEDGVLIVDDQFPQMVPKIKTSVNSLGGKNINFVLNTHWHFDHAEGNISLGPEGAWLVSQSNSRKMMQLDRLIDFGNGSYKQEAYPSSAWPDITFDESVQFHLNDERIEVKHFGPAHTAGDAVVIFRKANVIHMGDVFGSSSYPIIDTENGGSLDGIINFCSAALKVINNETIVIPGHGAITNYKALADYVVMLSTIRDRMLKLIKNGATLDQIYSANITKDWDQVRRNPDGFINRAYISLIH
jgi:cyclase